MHHRVKKIVGRKSYCAPTRRFFLFQLNRLALWPCSPPGPCPSRQHSSQYRSSSHPAQTIVASWLQMPACQWSVAVPTVCTPTIGKGSPAGRPKGSDHCEFKRDETCSLTAPAIQIIIPPIRPSGQIPPLPHLSSIVRRFCLSRSGGRH